MSVQHYGSVRAQQAEWVEEGVTTYISLKWNPASLPSNACPHARKHHQHNVENETEIVTEQCSEVTIALVDEVGKEDVQVQVVDELPPAFASLTQSLSKSKFGFTPITTNGIDYTVSVPNFPYDFAAQSPSKIGATITELFEGLDEQSSIFVLGNFTYSTGNLDLVQFNNYFFGEESAKNNSQKDGAVLILKQGKWKGLFFSYTRQLQSWIRTHGDATKVPVYPGKLYMACGTEQVDTNPAQTASLLYPRELPQPAVTSYPTSNQTYVIVYLRGGYSRNAVLDALVKVPRTYGHGCLVDPNDFGILFYVDQLQGLNPNDRLEINIGFSPELWRTWGQDIPKDMRPFKARTSPDGKYHMPATGGDIALHIKASRPELLLDVTARFNVLISGQEEKVQVHNTYNGPTGRNLFGFFDAPTSSLPPCGLYQRLTQNPVMAFGPVENVTDRGRIHTSLIGSDDETHKNGSFFLTQLYLFEMDKFNRLTEDEQSDVFGRDKQTGYFLNSGITNAVTTPTIPFCHVIRSSISLDDPPTKFAHIYRQAGSYVDPQGTPGLFFACYSADSSLFDQTLDQMMGLRKPIGKPIGVDTMMEFVKTLSGQYFYVPNYTRLFRLWEVKWND